MLNLRLHGLVVLDDQGDTPEGFVSLIGIDKEATIELQRFFIVEFLIPSHLAFPIISQITDDSVCEITYTTMGFLDDEDGLLPYTWSRIDAQTLEFLD